MLENFIDVSLEKYGLDPSYYISAPALGMDAMLKMTEIELELLTDPDMYLFFEDGIRGGVSTIMNRYLKANNAYMGNIRGKTTKEIMVENSTLKKKLKPFVRKWKTEKFLTRKKKQPTSYIWMQIIYTDGL